MIKYSYKGHSMKKTYQSANIACGSCANLIKVSLEDTYGEIEVNLDSNPREVTVEINSDEQEIEFIKEMAELGFEVVKN